MAIIQKKEWERNGKRSRKTCKIGMHGGKY